MTRSLRFIIPVSLIAIVHACTSGGPKEERDVTADLSPEQKKAFEEQTAEIEIGRQMAGRLLQVYGAYDDDGLRGYVNQVGNYVASYGDFAERRYMFEILDSDMVNAFACPGGYILISLGALRTAKTEAELAAVLGHEAAHVGKRHMFDRLRSMSKEELEKAAAEAEKNANLTPEMKVRKRTRPEQSEAGSVLARYLSGAAGGLNILAASKAGMSVILEKGLGAEKEFEADQEGVKWAVRAGYEPGAMIDYFCRLEHWDSPGKGRCKVPGADKKSKKDTILEKTHPATRDRVDQINKLLASLKSKEIVGASGAQRYESQTKNIPKAKTKS